MRGPSILRAVVFTLLALGGGVVAAAPARGPGLQALAALQAGRWELRADGADRPDRMVCLPNAAALIQYGHRGAQCSRFVIEDEPRHATVHYTCPGKGHGRTTIRLETPRRIAIETQGVAGGRPFQIHLDGRRVGSCRGASRR